VRPSRLANWAAAILARPLARAVGGKLPGPTPRTGARAARSGEIDESQKRSPILRNTWMDENFGSGEAERRRARLVGVKRGRTIEWRAAKADICSFGSAKTGVRKESW